jgi:hypothetical protein
MPSTLDAYSLPARGVPFAAVFAAPLVLLGAGVITTTTLGIASGLVLAVIAAIAGQLGRDRGRKIQDAMWVSWGGSPTLQRLRFSDNPAHEGRVERLHARIEAILREPLPTAEDERRDSDDADDRYNEASARLRALAGNRERFPHLFAENVNYGQRRNLLGLKPTGIAVAVLTIIAAGLALWLAHGTTSARIGRYAPGAAVAVAMLAFWLLIVKPSWVRVTAEAYADQFVGAIDILYAEQSTNQASTS